MADFIIKPASGDTLKLQDEGGDDAITISTTGNTTLAGTANNLGTVTAGSIAGGSITSATTFPAGHVIQTTYNTFNSSLSATTTSNDLVRVVDSGSNLYWTGQITNVGADNDVLVTMSFPAHCSRESASTGMGWGLFRESTKIKDCQSYGNYYWVADSGHKNWYIQITLTWIDESPATGTNNYYLGYSTSGGGDNNGYTQVYSQSNMMPFTCVLQEIQT
tara:strand:+ start:330 stop:986 length:657 start_codon:yes stop_codon:yes gene_type:complete